MKNNEFEKMVKLTATLRSKHGCPWDRAQTHSSVKKHLIEEAYEVCDAMDSKDAEKFKDELGDLLFQVLFHAQMAKERGKFDIHDILRNTYEKMIRRHPHVFGKRKAKDAEDAYKHWQERKEKEPGYKNKRSSLNGIPKALPALIKAQKVSRRVSSLGFEWPNAKTILDKIEEELYEIKRAAASRKKRPLAEEIGDMLFAIVSLARYSGIDAEGSLNNATKKFSQRFQRLERMLKKRGKKIRGCSLKELAALWDKASSS